MKKTLLLAFSLSAILSSSAMAQGVAKRNCGTMNHLAAQQAADPALEARMQQIEQQTQQIIASNSSAKTAAIVTIPVVFHVVYNSSSQNISDAQCIAQLNQLNLDYARLNSDASSTPSVFTSVSANTQIQFCLAQRDASGAATTGIIHKSTASTSFIDDDKVKSSSTGGDNAWDATKYLNIWSCNLGGGLLGYAQFPGGSNSTDGVVCLYSSIGSMTSPGTATPYHLGRTMTHEVGHWLNLRHIWGDASCGNDLVSDTPTQSTSNFGCPTFPHVTCSNGPNGDMFMNYMDYTDDGCMNQFTAGQSARMQAIFASGGARVAMLSSLGCQAPATGGSCGVPASLASSAITTSSATLSWGAVSGAASYNVQYRVVGASSWTSASSTSTSLAVASLAASSNYEFQVQGVCTSASSAFSSSSTFTTAGVVTGCSDAYESNNTSSTAKTIAVNTDIVGLIGTSSDLDWFTFTTVSPNTNLNLTLTNLAGDYDLRLYNSSKSTLTTSQNGGTTAEQIIRNTTTAAKYYVKVYGYGGAFSASQCYTLRINASSSTFRIINDGDNSGKGNTDDGITALYPNPTKDYLNIYYTSANDLQSTIQVTDQLGRVVIEKSQELTTGENKFSVDVHSLAKGIYFISMTVAGEFSVQKFVVE